MLLQISFFIFNLFQINNQPNQNHFISNFEPEYKQQLIHQNFDIPNQNIARDSIYLLEIKNTSIGVLIDLNKWSIQYPNNNNVEFNFSNIKDSNINGTLITEKINLNTLKLPNIVLKKIKNSFSDAKIIKKNFVVINGLEIISIKIKATIENEKYIYYGYLYSNGKDSVQLITYLPENLFNKNKKDLDDFLKGLVEVKTSN
ncbi:MAG: hypothetical protein QM478_07690 [Flavobacteriaceae bacterium]